MKIIGQIYEQTTQCTQGRKIESFHLTALENHRVANAVKFVCIISIDALN